MAAMLAGVGFAMGEIMGGRGGGGFGLGAALLIWIVMASAAWFGGRDILLGLSGARKIEKKDNPRLYNIVEEMCIASGMETLPAVHIIDDPAPNAFAAGRDPSRAAVAVTTGLLERLNRDELQGVIAHEIGHIKNRDTLYMTMTGVLLGAIVLLADFGMKWMFWGGMYGRRSRSSRSEGGGQAQLILMAVSLILIILSPFIAQIIYFAVSRKREYLADASGALYTRYPEGLASALQKIASGGKKLKTATRATAPMYIVNPLQAAKGRRASSLMSTHPATEERIRILRGMGAGFSLAEYEQNYNRLTGKSGPLLGGGAGVQPFAHETVSKPAPTAPQRAVAGEAAASTEPDVKESAASRRRETSDMLWRMNKYSFIECGCGAKLKIPPDFPAAEVRCPHCGTMHEVAKQ